jgi:hypothetical protein
MIVTPGSTHPPDGVTFPRFARINSNLEEIPALVTGRGCSSLASAALNSSDG